MNTHLFILCNI